MAADGILLTRFNVPTLTFNDITSFCCNEYWHKFIIENGASFDKENVLNAILETISPLDMVPVKYSVAGKDSYFLARKCGQVIERFYQTKMAPIKLGNSCTVHLSIHACYMPINDLQMNMQFHLIEAIKKRNCTSSEGYVDLSVFHKEPGLYEILFCPLSKPKILHYVLSILKTLLHVTAINLSSNGIENLEPLEALADFMDLQSLNLSNNKIHNRDCIELIGRVAPGLTEIHLTGNPVCSTFKTEQDYINWITSYVPSIRRIDDVPLSIGMAMHQVWLPNANLAPVLNEFIRHYFLLYDCDRKSLEEMYTKDSIFSLTCGNLSHANYKGLRSECYNNKSRALLKLFDRYKLAGPVYLRNDKIVELLCKLPVTKHELSSFKVDAMNYKKYFIMVVVSGVFKEHSVKPELRSFNRTFVLKKVDEREFKISNDLYNINNATEDEIETSSSEQITADGTEQNSKFLIEEEKKRKMIQVVANLTSMNHKYSERCLKDCNWDVTESLKIFLENYQTAKIPDEAFT